MTSRASERLGDVTSIDRTTVSPDEVARSTLYIGLENIERGGKIVGVRSVDEIDLSSVKFRFTEHHVLFGKLRPYLAKVARPDFGGICSTDILPILPGPGLDRSYLAHFLSLPETIALATARATGANLPRISPKEVASFKVPILEIEEQRRVAEVLDLVDGLRVKRRAGIAALSELERSAFVEFFGDPRVGESRWPRSTVADVADQVTDGEHITPKREERGIKLLSARNVRDGYIDFENVDYIGEEEYERIRKRCDPRRGDVLISCSGTIGRVATVETDEPFALVRSAALIKPKRSMVTSAYLATYLRMPALKA